MTTAERLAAAIREAATEPRHERLAKRAETGYYDDYKSALAFPINQLVRDCLQTGLHALAQRAMDGEFDATSKEADAWRHSPEGQELFSELYRGKP